MTRRRPLLAVLACLLPLALAAQDLPPLKEVERVREGIITAGMVLAIAHECPELEVRQLRGIAFLNGLRAHAERLGYTRAEIEAYLDDSAEEARLTRIALDRLAAMGAVEGDPDGVCAAGRAQIAAGTQIGRLLR